MTYETALQAARLDGHRRCHRRGGRSIGKLVVSASPSHVDFDDWSVTIRAYCTAAPR